MNADDVARGREFALNVIDGQVLFPQGDGAFADPVARRRLAGSGAWHRKEGRAFIGGVAEVVAKDPKGSGRITEASGGFGGGELLEVEGAQRLVLALGGKIGGREELSGLKIR